MDEKSKKLYLPLFGGGGAEPRKLVIEYLNGKPGVENQDLRLTVLMNNNIVNTVVCGEGKQVILLDINSELLDKDIQEISLEISELWKPSDFAETTDLRELGLGVFSVELL